MNRFFWIVAIVCLGACARAGSVAPAPEAAGTHDAAPVQQEVVSEFPVADDSAADQAALEALDTLEFRSLDRRAGHLRGELATPNEPVSAGDVAQESERMFTASRGGTAAVSGPTYDIDVESFAAHARVQYYIDFFLGPARDRFTIWLGRLNRYEGMIRTVLRSRGVPEDMVYLALIESGYSNTAVSRARAVGMWQFISSTGLQYGLQADTWVDDRRDPFKATDAAARHLSDLNDRFGSWYLAAAAYNGGPGRVSRGLQRLQSDPETQSDTTFFTLYDRRYLRRETRDYVPKLIAAALIAKNPERYGFRRVPSQQPLVFDEVTVTDATGLDVLARLADTTTWALIELNPHFIRRVTPPRRTVIARVPRGTGPMVAQRWAELPASERVSFLEHRIAKDETLSLIGKRYGVSVQLLTAANPGIQPRRLRVGQRVVIPVSSAARSQAAAGQAPQPTAEGRYHTVQRGDSLWRISQRYGVRISDLQGWNGIRSGEVLRVGQRVRVNP